MKKHLLALICSLFLSCICAHLIIPLLRKLKAGQPILHYVEEHKNKAGTPTMGGLFFILPSSLIFLFFGQIQNEIAKVSLSLGLAYMIIGFLDDYIKIRYKTNQGLKAYQKIIFQFSIALIAGIYAFNKGLTHYYLPFSNKEINLGFLTIPIITLVFLAITNSVNLTDGLDGLAGQVSLSYLIFITALMLVQYEKLTMLYLGSEEYYNLSILSACLIGGILAFLIFNMNKARVFMGDTGSLSLGGFIGAISIFSLNAFFIPLIGIMFVLSSISVIMQVFYYKLTKKRVFLMAPIHHHFQLKGYSETQIAYCYSLITIVCGILALFQYL